MLEFEKTTGWKLNSEYIPMPDNISTYLHNSFDRYNILLFQMLNCTSFDLNW